MKAGAKFSGETNDFKVFDRDPKKGRIRSDSKIGRDFSAVSVPRVGMLEQKMSVLSQRKDFDALRLTYHFLAEVFECCSGLGSNVSNPTYS